MYKFHDRMIFKVPYKGVLARIIYLPGLESNPQCSISRLLAIALLFPSLVHGFAFLRLKTLPLLLASTLGYLAEVRQLLNSLVTLAEPAHQIELVCSCFTYNPELPGLPWQTHLLQHVEDRASCLSCFAPVTSNKLALTAVAFLQLPESKILFHHGQQIYFVVL